MMQKRPAPKGSTAGPRRSPFARFVWFGAALGVFAVSSFIAFRQPPRMDAFARPSPLSADWWTQPIERNAPRRLPLVWGNLNDVFALRGTGKVWAVGEGGLVLHSDDYGRHWTRQYLMPQEVAGKPASAAWLRELAPTDALAAVSLVGIAELSRQQAAEQIDRQQRRSAGAKTVAPPVRPAQPRQAVPAQAQQAVPAQTPPAEPPLSLANLARSTLWSVQFVDASYGWVAGDGGALFSTSDGGERWERRDAGVPLVLDLRGVSFTDRENGSLVGRRSDELLETSDGGQTWRAVPVQGIDSRNKVKRRIAQLVVMASKGSAESYARLLRVVSSVPFQNATRQAVDCDIIGNRV